MTNLKDIYLLIISGNVILHAIALMCTWYALTFIGGQECNPISAWALSSWGFIIYGFLSLAIIAGVFYVVPYLPLRIPNQRMWVICILAGIVALGLNGMDAMNDILAILNSPFQHYFFDAISVIYNIGPQALFLNIKMTR